MKLKTACGAVAAFATCLFMADIPFLLHHLQATGINARWMKERKMVVEKVVAQNDKSFNENKSEYSTVPKPHPHAGARDSMGRNGYIVDVTAVQSQHIQSIQQQLPKHPTAESEEICALPGPSSDDKLTGFDMLVNKVVVTTGGESGSPQGKILCAVYSHKKRHDQIAVITETWGWKCDGFFAASTQTVDDPKVPGFGAIDLQHAGPEQYKNMWQKTRSILAYMYDHFRTDYDYFYVAGDDTYLVVENLRLFLSSLDQKTVKEMPLYLGIKFLSGKTVYAAGGGGYVLNKVTLTALVEQALPDCHADEQVSWEDVNIGKCLKSLGIFVNNTVDDAGAQRFHAFHLDEIAQHTVKMSGFVTSLHNMWAQDNGWRVGEDLVSSSSIAFHKLKTPVDLRRYHAILYRTCLANTPLGHRLSSRHTPAAA